MKKVILLGLIFITSVSVNAQQLLSPTSSFSKKKTSFVTLNTGVEIKGSLEDLDYKKGLIKSIAVKDGAGVKHKLKPSSVKFMYLSPSLIAKIDKAADMLTDSQKWNDEKIDQDLINQGYVYFETTNVKIKKKTRPLLMQLLNPTFSKGVSVYYNPFAKETASLGVGGIKVVGGNEKSYYIQLENDPAAYLLEKKDYKKQFVALWKKCPELAKKSSVNWSDLNKDIIKYSNCK